jgi:hypothetical protein
VSSTQWASASCDFLLPLKRRIQIGDRSVAVVDESAARPVLRSHVIRFPERGGELGFTLQRVGRLPGMIPRPLSGEACRAFARRLAIFAASHFWRVTTGVPAPAKHTVASISPRVTMRIDSERDIAGPFRRRGSTLEYNRSARNVWLLRANIEPRDARRESPSRSCIRSLSGVVAMCGTGYAAPN